jgi:hypothetical protein
MRFRVLAFFGALCAAMAMAATANARAVEFTDNEFVPFTGVTLGCGDIIVFSGTVHLLSHVTFNASGGVTIHQHSQPQGVTGTGLFSGAKYQGTGVTQQTLTDNGPGTQFEFTFVNNFRLIGRGVAPNFNLHQTLHVTVDNNGRVTATHDSLSVECRG